MAWTIFLIIMIPWLSFCQFGWAMKRMEREKSIDLNRTPSPENILDDHNYPSQPIISSNAEIKKWESGMEKQRLSQKAYRDRIQLRKKLNISTPNDKKFFENNNLRQKKRFKKNPEIFRIRSLQSYYKKKAAKMEAKEKGEDQDLKIR